MGSFAILTNSTAYTVFLDFQMAAQRGEWNHAKKSLIVASFGSAAAVLSLKDGMEVHVAAVPSSLARKAIGMLTTKFKLH